MKPKLENIQDALKILEKKYEIPKHWYQVEFPKSKKKRREKMDTIWKNYTIFLYAKKRLTTCIGMIQNKLVVLAEKNEQIMKDIKSFERNRNKMKENMCILGHLAFAAFDGFAIIKEKGGKYYLKQGQAEKFYNSLTKEYGNDLTKVAPRLRSFKYDYSKIKDEKTIIKFPNKIDTIEDIVRDKVYWKQHLRLYKSIKYKRHKNDKNPIHYKNPIDAMKNKDLLRDEFRVLYKRSMKLTQEKEKYNLKFFINYEPKFKYHWTSHWRFFLKII